MRTFNVIVLATLLAMLLVVAGKAYAHHGYCALHVTAGGVTYYSCR